MKWGRSSPLITDKQLVLQPFLIWTRGVDPKKDDPNVEDPNKDDPRTNGQLQKRTEGCAEQKAVGNRRLWGIECCGVASDVHGRR